MRKTWASSEVREMIELRLKAMRDGNTRLDRARENGLAAGIEQGRAEALREAARRLLGQGLDRETVLSALNPKSEDLL